jgi:hypothetical protein
VRNLHHDAAAIRAQHVQHDGRGAGLAGQGRLPALLAGREGIAMHQLVDGHAEQGGGRGAAQQARGGRIGERHLFVLDDQDGIGQVVDEDVTAPFVGRQGIHRLRGGGIVLDDQSAGRGGGVRDHGISMTGNAWANVICRATAANSCMPEKICARENLGHKTGTCKSGNDGLIGQSRRERRERLA